MAREELVAETSKQEEAIKKYLDDALRRFEERHQAAQRERHEHFIRLEESLSKLLEQRHRRSSRPSSRTSHRSDARNKAPSEVAQHHRHRQHQERHRPTTPHPQEQLDPQQKELPSCELSGEGVNHHESESHLADSTICDLECFQFEDMSDTPYKLREVVDRAN